MSRLSMILGLVFMFSAGFIYSQASENKTEAKMESGAAKLYNEGNDLMGVGDYNGAIENYDKALKIDSDYRIYYQRGIAQKKAKMLNEAEESFKKSIELNPNFVLAYNALGSVEFSLKDYQASVAHFEKFKDMTENTSYKNAADQAISFAYLKMGQDAIEKGNNQGAMNYLKKSIQSYNNDGAYLMLARVYIDNKQFQQAIDAANNAKKYKKTITSGGPYYYLGIAYKNLGDMEKAKQNLEASAKDQTYKKQADYELAQLK